jgi:DNA-binding CsgD family transcriptional regulator
MPLYLPQLIRGIASATDAHQVLDALDRQAGPLHVLLAWPLCTDGDLDTKDIIYHDSIPTPFRQAYGDAITHHGTNQIRLALTNPLPFTFSEARKRINPSGSDRWLWQLLQDHGVRDGFVVHDGCWIVAYWSERVLGGIRELDRETRMALHASGAAAIYRLKELVRKGAVRSVGLSPVELSPRELAVLEHLARGMRLPATAKQMELSVPTVRIYLRRAQKKFSAVTPTQATAIAVRRKLV